MPRGLIDTDIFSEIFKKRDPNVAKRALAYQEEQGSFSITVITAMEITSGLHRVRATAQIARFEAMLAGCESWASGRTPRYWPGRSMRLFVFGARRST
jgi:tRNA(fMet)-specific endonuclease VapC